MPDNRQRTTMQHEYLFDCTLLASIRVKASSKAEAIKRLHNSIDCSSANLGAWADGPDQSRPILCEVSLEHDDEEPICAEIDGEVPE